MNNENKIKRGVIYCRVSTSKQAGQGESLETQEKICRSLAKQRNIKIVPNNRIFKEGISGANRESRVAFNKMIDFIKKNKNKVDYLIFRDIDRLTRAGSTDYGEIKRMLWLWNIELVDSLGLIQPQINTMEAFGLKFGWSMVSTSDTSELLRAEGAKNEKNQILTRLFQRLAPNVRAGYHTGPPNDGFKNKQILDGNNKRRTIMIPDKKRMDFFIKMFNLRVSGQYTDHEIVEIINSQGYRTKIKNRKNREKTKVIGKCGEMKLTIKQLQRFIKNPIYCGVKVHKWLEEPIKTKFEGLVDINTFNRANRGKVYIREYGDDKVEVLYNYSPTKIINRRNKNNPDFPFKFILCPKCGKPMLGSYSKGKLGNKFPYYHCSRGHKYYGVGKKKFEKNVIKYIEQLGLNKEDMKEFNEVLKETWQKRKRELMGDSTRIESHIEELKIKRDSFFEAFAGSNSEIIRKGLEKKIENIEKEIKKAKKQSNKMKLTDKDLNKFIKYSEYFIEHLDKMLIKSKEFQKKQAVFELVFDKTPHYEQLTNGTPEVSFIFQYPMNSKDKKYHLVPPSTQSSHLLPHNGGFGLLIKNYLLGNLPPLFKQSSSELYGVKFFVRE